MRRQPATQTAPEAPGGVQALNLGVQRLILEDFPPVDLARALSSNGRAHWAVRQKAKKAVQIAVWEAWVCRQDDLVPVPPPARVTYRWIVPDRKERDIDNHHGSGVVKACQDALVKLVKLLPGGDHATALTSSVEIVYEKGRRALVIEIEPAEGEV